MPYHHLRTRSEYSLLTSALKLADLEQYIKENNVKAICLMDDMSLSAGLRWSMHLSDMHSVKPLIGLNVFIGKEIYPFNNPYPQLGLIAKNQTGYLNLLKILKYAHFEHYENDFQQLWVELKDIKPYTDGVICLTGGYRGIIAYEYLNFGKATAIDTLEELSSMFKNNIYIELTRHGRTREKEIEDFFIDYAYKKNIPLVATNDPCFLKKEHFTAFDILGCIRDKQVLTDATRKRLNQEYYLKSAEEMEELFSDIPEAIENTEQIVKKCSFCVEKRPSTLPHYCNSTEEEARMMEELARKGMEERFTQINWEKAVHKKEEYLERLKYEIEVIEKMGFPGYFLIVADFVQWSKKNGVAVGAGRGSGAGSLVAWCLKITEVDPLEYGLFFERFLNPERVSMPDFDIDFCQENRWKTIEYVMNKYGRDSVSRIITYGKMKAKMVIRDVGRVMQISFSNINEILKLIPFNPLEPITLQKALEMVPRLKEEKETDPKMRKLLDIAMDLEDLNRNTSMHAAGVVIGDKPLVEIGPVCSEENNDDINEDDIESAEEQKKSAKKDIEKDEDNNTKSWFHSKPENRIAVFGYDMKDCEKIGLVKFDFLGLQTLTVLTKACEMIKANTGTDVDVLRLPTDDEKTFKLLQTGHLKGVFQLETPLPRNALKKIKTNKILDIAAITSLNRPGPMENMPSFIRRKMGEEKIDYYHPVLKPILEETYGIIIYQEQVMEVARKIAGYSLGEADLLRRAMGKKIKEEMDKQSAIFIDRAEKVGLMSREEARKIFDIIEKFAGYGFNKAHAVSYTIISYQTAYLKAHYPVEFMVALMNLDINKTDKLNGFINEAKNMGIEIVPPDVNISTAEFSCKDGKIIYALGAIKGMGVELARQICNIRDEMNKKEQRSGFKNLQGFFTHCGHLLNKKTIESFIKSASWKNLGFNIRTLLENEQSIVDTALEFTRRTEEQKNTSVMNMFGEDDNIPLIPKLKIYPEYDVDKLANLELEIFGFYMSTNSLEQYEDKLNEYNFAKSTDVAETTFQKEQLLLMTGIITKITMRFNKNKKKFAFVNLVDLDGMYETMIFNDDLLNERTKELVEGKKVAIEVSARTNPETGTRLQIMEIYDIDDFFEKFKEPKDFKFSTKKKSYNDKSTKPAYPQSSINNNEKSYISKDQRQETKDEQLGEKVNSTKLTDDISLKSQTNKIKASKKIVNQYNCLQTKIEMPDNTFTIYIKDMQDILTIKKDIEKGKYSKFNYILLVIGESKFLIKIDNKSSKK